MYSDNGFWWLHQLPPFQNIRFIIDTVDLTSIFSFIHSLYSEFILCTTKAAYDQFGKCNTLVDAVDRTFLEQSIQAGLLALSDANAMSLPHTAACEDLASEVFNSIFTGTTSSAGRLLTIKLCVFCVFACGEVTGCAAGCQEVSTCSTKVLVNVNVHSPPQKSE